MKERTIKNFLLYHLVFLLSCWFIVWISMAWLDWGFSNPISWLLDIPYNQDVRGNFLVCPLIYLLTVGWVSALPYFDVKGSSNNSSKEENNLGGGYQPTPRGQQNKSIDAVDIALGVGAGVVGAEIVTDILGIGED